MKADTMTDTSEIVCGADAMQRLVAREEFDGRMWWWVFDLRTREALSGGFDRRSQAVAEARRLGTPAPSPSGADHG